MTLQIQIEEALAEAFSPEHIDVTNESHMHNVPPGSESHFKVVLVAAAFEGKRQVQRHQAVYGALKEPMQQGVHALALHTYTPTEWQSRAKTPESPQCLGGGKG